MRALLDARSEAQAVHGLEIRTELGFGDVAEELTRRLAESPEQLLILGVSDISVVTQRFAALLSRTARPGAGRVAARRSPQPRLRSSPWQQARSSRRDTFASPACCRALA